MSIDIEDVFLNCKIKNKLIDSKFVFLKVYKNLIKLLICQKYDLIDNEKIDLLKMGIAWPK